MVSRFGMEAREPEGHRNGLRNYMVHSVEGGFFMGGLAFVAPESVLPRIVESLGGPAWVISLMPVALVLGIVTPGLFTAHVLERLERTLPAVLLMGLVQRLPFLAAGLTLLLVGESMPRLVLCVVVLAPLISGLAGGVTLPAWMELIAKTLAPNRRASAMAIRQIIAAMIGLASGAVISAVLFHLPGVAGYGVLHLIAFGFLMLSLTVLALAREEAVHPGHHGPAVGLMENLRAIPAIVRGTPGIGTFLAVRVLSCGFFIALPFLAIHALDTSNLADSYLGALVAAQMVGGIIGNVVGGVLGDRTGTRNTTLTGIGSLLALCLVMPWCIRWWQFVAGFALFGFGYNAMRIGMVTLGIELSPLSKRGTVVATIGWSMGLGLVASSALGGLLWEATGGIAAPCAAGAVSMAAALLLLCRVAEPRRRTSPPTIRA